MIDNIKLANYKSFFADQVKEAIDEQQKINRSQMRNLFKTGELSLAYVDSIQHETGMIILKCPRRMAPRLKVLKGVCIIKKGAKQALGEQVTEWICRWEEFVDNKDFHSPGSDMTPMYYVHTGDSNYDYVACSGFSIKLYDILSKALADGKSLSLIIHNPFPPVEYFRNLANYMDAFSSNEELNLEPTIDYDEWTPEELAFDEQKPTGISDTIIDTLANEHCCIVQGPPGTGKSYTIASVISSYLDAGKTVCVTTMANKGLIELIKQKPLQKYVKGGRVSKTNLSIDERKQVSGVKAASADLQVPGGEMLCATNYQLSSVFSEKKMTLYGLPQYDLVVIEEASQAFLTAIVAFKQLGGDCLIVGDPMQLPPIVKLNNPQYNSWNVATQVEGLKSMALGTSIKSYRIVTTFRLTSRSASLTKCFYGNRFVSVKKDYLDFTKANSVLFPQDGGVLYHCTLDVRNGVYSDKADTIIRDVIEKLEKFYPDRSLAIITPFRDSVKEIVFDIDKIKAILNDENDKRDATDVIDSASSRNLYDENKDDHYFIVTLCNIDLQYPALLNKDIIADYLREVAPVDYSAQFRNQLIMTSVSGEYEELQKNVGYFPISINGTAIEKRYGLRVVGTNDTINGLEYFSLKDDTYGLLAWGWYALTDFTKAIPVSDTSSQFRLRKHNIQVGEADMLTTYFPRNETRGNKYFYGEIHIANQKIKLNSARDGLAPTPEAECLKCLIRNFFDGLVKLYHLANDTKKAVERYIDAYKIIQAPATENIVNAQKQLTDACKKLKSITKSKNATNPVAQKVLESYKRRIKDLHTEMDQEIPCIPASELPISSPIPQVEPELDDFEILNNHYPEDLAALIRRVCMSYQRNCPVSHIKLIRELQRKAIRELIEE